MIDFFTSANLLGIIKFTAVGTFITNRKNSPKLAGKLVEKRECEMVGCNERILGIRRKDTKDVLLLSNCHQPTVGSIKRKMKDDSTKEIRVSFLQMKTCLICGFVFKWRHTNYYIFH